MECKGQWNGGYIEASQEAYDLLIENRYTPFNQFTFLADKRFEYYIIDNNSTIIGTRDDIPNMDKFKYPEKQFYINNGELSWEKPEEKKTSWSESKTFGDGIECDEDVEITTIDEHGNNRVWIARLKPEEKAKKNTYTEYYCDYCGNKVPNQAFGGNKDDAFYCTPECASNANLGIEKPEETVPLSEKIKDSNMSADNKHPLLNQDSKHYSMVDDVEAIERMEQMYSSSDLMAWAKLSAMKYRLRIGSKDDVTKEAKKIETYEAYYSYLKTK